MAIVDISEYTRLGRDSQNNVIQTGPEPARVYQQVAIAAGSTQSAAFDSATRFVRVHTDAVVRLIFGANPTAAAGTSFRMAAGATEFFEVIPGQKLATITTT
jgi:hypothetical protein